MKALREAAAGCRGCGLWEDATQTVFGTGPPRTARMVLVGEQPGDREDREGEPFVGPAGRVLDQALREAGIERRETYVTNAVKHFKWRPAGKRRLHQRPNAEEIRACRPWLDAELAVVRPEVLVALGATAAKALFGPSFRVTRDRGTFLESDLAPHATATVHPSSLLRIDDSEERRMAEQELAEDLARAAAKLDQR
jgi:DNA polymerase